MSVQHVIVIDDDAAVLDSTLVLLNSAGYRARGFSGPEDLLAVIEDLSRACIVTDVRMPKMDGLTLLRRLADLGCGDWPFIVITGHADVPMAVEAMRLGAIDFLEKPYTPARLLEMVAVALAGIAERHSPESEAAKARFVSLTNREREVITQLIAGKSSKTAAIALGISPRTVDVFRAKILRKMAVDNVAALATLIARHKIA